MTTISRSVFYDDRDDRDDRQSQNYFKTMLLLEGTQYNIDIDFPLERGVFIEVKLTDRKGQQVERWEYPIPKQVFYQYRLFIPAVKDFLKKILYAK